MRLPILFGVFPHLERLHLFVPVGKCSESRLLHIVDELDQTQPKLKTIRLSCISAAWECSMKDKRAYPSGYAGNAALNEWKDWPLD